MTPMQTIAYDAIYAAAEAGIACPSNRELGALMKRDSSNVSAILAQLVTRGLLLISSSGGQRVVTITATGRSTKPVQRFNAAQQNEGVEWSFDARLGCQRLLAAQLRTGAHWINDPARMRSAMREAGMAA